MSIGRIDANHRDVEDLINRRCTGVGARYLVNYIGWARRPAKMEAKKDRGNPSREQWRRLPMLLAGRLRS